MKKLLLAALAACLFVSPSPAVVIDYSTLVKFSDLEAVDSYGNSTWATSHGSGLYTVTLVGVVINDPADMLDYVDEVCNPEISNKIEWQTYIQAVDPNLYGITVNNWSDFGGAALYMMKYSHIGSSQYYSDDKWLTEMDRVNYPTLDDGGTVQLRRGDVIVVQAQAPGREYLGKFNINEKHMKDDKYDFTITVLAENTAITTPTITLSDLLNTDNTPIFNQTRQTGCEKYQGTLVHLDNLVLYDDPAKTNDDWTCWGENATVTVKQLGEGDLTFDLKLGLDSDLFTQIDAESLQTTPFSITAIMDQESATGDRTIGYRLWLTSFSDITVVPEPGSLAPLAAAVLSLAALRRRRSSDR